MFLQFLDLYGSPVHVRPERVDAVRGIAVNFNGDLRHGALIVMTNRETFRVRGTSDQIVDALNAWMAEHAPKAILGECVAIEPQAVRIHLSSNTPVTVASPNRIEVSGGNPILPQVDPRLGI